MRAHEACEVSRRVHQSTPLPWLPRDVQERVEVEVGGATGDHPASSQRIVRRVRAALVAGCSRP